jgi:NAD(P) transhydrogenase subunit alpha
MKVPQRLHTPLTSGSNAISGITAVGAIVVAAAVATDAGFRFGNLLGLLAVVLAMVNVAGGFVVTHRMLEMFNPKKK